MTGGPSAPLEDLLAAARAGEDLDHPAVSRLLRARGPDLEQLVAAADALRAEQVGPLVSYVVNRNINFTSACVKRCRFCAFARGYRDTSVYRLSRAEVVSRAVEAAALGATEVCLQAGLAPELTGRDQVALCAAVHEAAPGLHIHGFSPEELRYGAQRAGWTVRELVVALREAGLGTVPGTSAEILVDEVRRRISPGRLSTAEWLETVRKVHEAGLRSSSTVMYGHVETPEHLATHLLLLRALQRETGGLTELVPLAFVHTEAPMWRQGLVAGVRPGPTWEESLALFATARLVLGRDLPHLQASWVKLGLEGAAALLEAGADDLGGTLMNESISTAAGAGHGQFQPPRVLRRLARSRGRVPVERSTTYGLRRAFLEEPAQAEILDQIRPEEADARFGSYAALSRRGAQAAR